MGAGVSTALRHEIYQFLARLVLRAVAWVEGNLGWRPGALSPVTTAVEAWSARQGEGEVAL